MFELLAKKISQNRSKIKIDLLFAVDGFWLSHSKNFGLF